MRFRHIGITLLFLLPFAVHGADEVFDYQLRDMDGRLYRASDYRGKWLVINFWATWCPPCLKEMPELERFQQQHPDTVQVWGVTFEDSDKASIRAFVERLGVSFPILGYGQDPLTGYGEVRLLPTTFLIDPDGLFHSRFEGIVTASDLADAIRRAAN